MRLTKNKDTVQVCFFGGGDTLLTLTDTRDGSHGYNVKNVVVASSYVLIIWPLNAVLS